MILKNSFLADSIENFKRRSWVFWLQFLGLFFVYPGLLLLSLNSMKADYPETVRQMEKMSNFTFNLLDSNEWISFFIVGIAVMAGIQALSWLHDKKQVNFYHSQPVRRNRRFLVIWSNGLVSYLAAYLINLILALIVAASYGSLTGEVIGLLPRTILSHFLLFLAIYHVAMIAVLLTGHTLVSLILTVVLLAYEVSAKALVHVYMDSFYSTYGYAESEKILDTVLSPVVTHFLWQLDQFNSVYSLKEAMSDGQMILEMSLLSLVFGVAAWLLYRKRASESHGKTIAFSKLQGPLKFLLLLLAGTVGGLAIYLLSGSSVVLGIAGVTFTVLLGHVVIQVIYEVDFRGIRKGLGSLGISLLAAVAAFVIFRWDLTGYDDRIPHKDRVKSVSLNLATSYWDNTRLLPDGTLVNSEQYWKNEMQITDLELVYAFLENRVTMEEYDELKKNAKWDFSPVQFVDVVFYLENGKTHNRKLFLNYEESLEILNEIFHLEAYQMSTNQLMNDNFAKDFNIFGAEYDNGDMNYKVPDELVWEMLELYKEDVKQLDFADLCNSLPVGRILVKGRGLQNPEYINEWRVPIYPAYTQTTDLLEEAGIPIEPIMDQKFLDQVKKISISYTDKEAMEANQALYDNGYRKRIDLLKETKSGGLAETDTRENMTQEKVDLGEETVVYEVTVQQLKEVLDQCVTQDVSYWSCYPNFGGIRSFDPDYAITVELVDSRNPDSVYTEHMYILKDGLPAFVQEMIALQRKDS